MYAAPLGGQGLLTSGKPATRETALALLLYVALLVASLYPQSLAPGHAIAYVGDSLESVYIVAWNVHQAFRSPAHLFDANIPVSYTHLTLPTILRV